MTVFRFKQFAVKQTDSAMKVGTDSVLLGSLVKAKYPKRILDMGTGTGLLALMMAQRFNEALIDAVEIEEKAFAEATYNATQSVFANRIKVVHQSVQEFAHTRDEKYDLIVSNPPYYEAENSFGIEAKSRSHARHTTTLSFDELLQAILKLLSENGSCWMILPKPQAERIITKAVALGLMCCHEIHVFPTRTKPHNRIIFCLTRTHSEKITQSFYIKGEHLQYSQSYKEVTLPFLLWNE
jgi:tRNA1Val (adenine37-N6)-methyltransferase